MGKIYHKAIFAVAACVATLSAVIGLCGFAKPQQSNQNHNITASSKANTRTKLTDSPKLKYKYVIKELDKIPEHAEILAKTKDSATKTDVNPAGSPAAIVKYVGTGDTKYYLSLLALPLVQSKLEDNYWTITAGILPELFSKGINITSFNVINPGEATVIGDPDNEQASLDATLVLTFNYVNDPFSKDPHVAIYNDGIWTSYSPPQMENLNIDISYFYKNVLFLGTNNGKASTIFAFNYINNSLEYKYKYDNISSKIKYMVADGDSLGVMTTSSMLVYFYSFSFWNTAGQLSATYTDLANITNFIVLWGNLQPAPMALFMTSYNPLPNYVMPVVFGRLTGGKFIISVVDDFAKLCPDPVNISTSVLLGYSSYYNDFIFADDQGIVYSYHVSWTQANFAQLTSEVNSNFAYYVGFSLKSYNMTTLPGILMYFDSTRCLQFYITDIDSLDQSQNTKFYNMVSGPYSDYNLNNALAFNHAVVLTQDYSKWKIPITSTLQKINDKQIAPISGNGAFFSSEIGSQACQTANPCMLTQPGLYRFSIFFKNKFITSINFWYKTDIVSLQISSGGVSTVLPKSLIKVDNKLYLLYQAKNNSIFNNLIRVDLSLMLNPWVNFNNSSYLQIQNFYSIGDNNTFETSYKPKSMDVHKNIVEFSPGIYQLFLHDVLGNVTKVYLEVSQAAFQAVISYSKYPDKLNLNLKAPGALYSSLQLESYKNGVLLYESKIKKLILKSEMSSTNLWKKVKIPSEFQFSISNNSSLLSKYLQKNVTWNPETNKFNLDPNWQSILSFKLSQEFNTEINNAVYKSQITNVEPKLHNYSADSLLKSANLTAPKAPSDYLNFHNTNLTFTNWLIKDAHSLFMKKVLLETLTPIVASIVLFLLLTFLWFKIRHDRHNPFNIKSVDIKTLLDKKHLATWKPWDQLLREFYFLHFRVKTPWLILFYKPKDSIKNYSSFETIRQLVKLHYHNGLEFKNLDGAFWTRNNKCTGKEWANILISSRDEKQYLKIMYSKYHFSKPKILLKYGLASLVANTYCNDVDPFWSIFKDKHIKLDLNLQLSLSKVFASYVINDFGGTMSQLRNFIEKVQVNVFGPSCSSNFKKNWKKVVQPQLSNYWSQVQIKSTFSQISHVNHMRNVIGKVEPPTNNTLQVAEYNEFYNLDLKQQRKIIEDQIKRTLLVSVQFLKISESK